MSLMVLAQRIVEHGDRDALRELHENRRVFQSQHGPSALMTEFLLDLKDRDLTFRWCGRDSVVVDQAYDLTLAKFLNLPSGTCSSGLACPTDGPDCRYYYRAFDDLMVREFEERPPASVMDADLRAAEMLQKLVTWHFQLSCLECKRRALKLVRRYRWKVNGDHLTLWLPVAMTGSHCRAWLQNNIPDVDASRPGERDRVQAMIDHLLARRRILSLDWLCEQGLCTRADDTAEPSTLEDETSAAGLASVVAEEKAENIDDQRPAIRAMGKNKLRELIRTVFESLAEDQYHAERIAAEFGLSEATFSRFAGCKWARDADMPGANNIPDLWCNTAHVLASDEDFVAVARKAGVWDRVRRVVGEVDREEGETE